MDNYKYTYGEFTANSLLQYLNLQTPSHFYLIYFSAYMFSVRPELSLDLE